MGFFFKAIRYEKICKFFNTIRYKTKRNFRKVSRNLEGRNIGFVQHKIFEYVRPRG